MTTQLNVVTARRAGSRLPLAGWERALICLLIVELLGFGFGIPGFFDSFGSLLGLTENFLPFGIVALGLSVVILTGGIDLSVGATAGLGAIVMAELWQHFGMSIWAAALIGIVMGAALGWINGLIITRLNTEPLIATLATSFIFRSIGTALSGESPPSGFPDSFNALGQGAIGGLIPYQLILFAVLAVLFGLLMSRSAYGRKIVMIGYNIEAARYSGMRVGRVVTSAYVISGAMSALAGIVLASYYSAVRPDMGDILLLTTITTVVLGGISIFGGEGSIAGVVLAVLLLGFLRQGMLIAGFSDMVTTMATGAILLAAITIRNLLSGRGTGVALLVQRIRFLGRSKTTEATE
ncbi:ABC transporter permease [Acidisoma cladoniae]|jgi:ribose/xylose/arabinose/galactoside ABC-type transport system permease subunit|uniref:ABC transporter permease n=1 Tax=Acidisoma cladoniae TaxID=3040935 RepID=UPI002551A6AA|nr:ABC transporter permease [Acidisoma sp. PAMC 29798]